MMPAGRARHDRASCWCCTFFKSNREVHLTHFSHVSQEAQPEFRPAGLPWDWHLPAVPRLPSKTRADALRPRSTVREMLTQMAWREPRLGTVATAPVR